MWRQYVDEIYFIYFLAIYSLSRHLSLFDRLLLYFLLKFTQHKAQKPLKQVKGSEDYEDKGTVND